MSQCQNNQQEKKRIEWILIKEIFHFFAVDVVVVVVANILHSDLIPKNERDDDLPYLFLALK